MCLKSLPAPLLHNSKKTSKRSPGNKEGDSAIKKRASLSILLSLTTQA
jgi:hypothetical protein